MPETTTQNKIFFHLGLPKTASTFLQRNVFPELNGIMFTKKHDFKNYNDIIKNAGNKNMLFSNEMDIGQDDIDKQIKNISNHYPESIPILFLRHHRDWIKSKYKYYIRKSGKLDFRGFFDIYHDKGRISQDFLVYMNKIKFLQEHFSHPPVIILYEELKKHPLKVIDYLSEIMDAHYDENRIKIKQVKTSYSDKQLYYIRKFNKRFPNRSYAHKPKLIKWFGRKPRQLVIHSIAFFTGLLPTKNMDDYALIPAEDLKKIDELYKKDYEEVKAYIQKQRQLLL